MPDPFIYSSIRYGASGFPDVYNGVLEIDELANAEDYVLSKAWGIALDAWRNQFIQTANLVGIKRFEDVLAIIADPSIETEQFRRERLMNRFSLTPPYSLPFLRQWLAKYAGPDATAYIDANAYTLYIESSALDQAWFQEMITTLIMIKPANMILVNKPYLSDGMLLSEAIEVRKIEFNYRLGTTWALGQKPFADFDEFETIKEGTMASIQPRLLNDVATFTAGEIAGVRLNRSVLITSFLVKEASQNVATIEYLVLRSVLSDPITTVELFDGDGNVLTSSMVFVPMLDDVTMKHTIAVKEGV